MFLDFHLKFRLDDISLIKPATNQVAFVEINYRKYFLQGCNEKKIPMEALVCLKKIIARI
jgi:hypothetical protein